MCVTGRWHGAQLRKWQDRFLGRLRDAPLEAAKGMKIMHCCEGKETLHNER